MPTLPLTLPIQRETYPSFLGCEYDQFQELYRSLEENKQYYLRNASHRIAEVHWLVDTLDTQAQAEKGPSGITTEGLLSLQIYLLLTCADTLGHCCAPSGGVKDRFFAFFHQLPDPEKERLVAAFTVFHTHIDDSDKFDDGGPTDDLIPELLADPRHCVQQLVQNLVSSERFEAVLHYLYYIRRNPFTHESWFPESGFNFPLAKLQMRRLGVPHPAVTFLRDQDRIESTGSGNEQYLVFYNSDDPVEDLRRAILRGLGQVVGCR